MAAADEQLAKVSNNLTLLREAMGSTLLPTVTGIATGLARMLGGLTAFVKRHEALVRFVLTFVAVGAAIAVIGGTLLAVVGGLMVFASVVGVAASAVAGFLGIAVAIGAAVALAVAAIIQFWPQISNFFTRMIPQAFHWGVALVKSLASGMLSALAHPIRAVERIGTIIRDHFVGHSPPPLGPLRALDRIHIMETIADRIRPAPIINAMRGAALATAIAVPAFGAGGAAGGAHTISYSPQVTINVSGASGSPSDIREAVLKALESDRERFMDALGTAIEHRNRRRFYNNDNALRKVEESPPVSARDAENLASYGFPVKHGGGRRRGAIRRAD